jgi:AcrR family transcriptional regulator
MTSGPGEGGTGVTRAAVAPPRPRRPTVADAERLARRTFMSGRRIDVGALAAELGVNRVTLYRWVGSREDLLVNVLWTLAERSLRAARAEATGQGAERVVQVVVRVLERAISDVGMRAFLRDEGELAMRLLTRADRGFQPRLVAAVAEDLQREVDAGTLTLDAELGEVAFVVVRIVETYTYLDLLTGEQPDARRAEPILRMLLRP